MTQVITEPLSHQQEGNTCAQRSSESPPSPLRLGRSN